MVTKEQIARINELARKAKTPEGLTAEELAERDVLRRAYIDSMKASLVGQLDHTVILCRITCSRCISTACCLYICNGDVVQVVVHQVVGFVCSLCPRCLDKEIIF